MKSPKGSESSQIRVLVVEDSPTQAERLKRLLEEHGYEVTVASNGRAALEVLPICRPALVFTDVVMPEMDGYTLSKEIKSNEHFRDIPVILLTSLSKPEDIIRGLQCGADNFIPKPFEEEYLLSRTEYILANRALRKKNTFQMGVEVYLAGEKHFITAERQQILDLLISTYEETTRLGAKLQQREKQLEDSFRILNAQYRMAEALNASRTTQEVMDKSLEQVMELPGIQAGWIFLREGETGFRLAAARGLPPALEAPGVMDGDCQCRRSLLAGELDQGTNILECERLQNAKGNTHGLHCHASIPLHSGDGRIGILNLAGPGQRRFDDEGLRILSGVGSQLAIALERAHLLEQLERKVEERTIALHHSEERYRRLFNESTSGIIVYELGSVGPGRIVEVNDTAVRVLGHSRDELLNMTPSDLGPADLPLGDAAPPTEKLRRGESVVFEQPVVAKDGTERILEIHSKPFAWQDGRRVLSEAHDVTERKKLEAQFRQSQKMEAVGRLAGGIAHDFNNLLGVIIGFSELLREHIQADDVAHRHIDQIRKAGDSAAKLTRQLLAFSRKQVQELRVLDLNSVISDIGRMLPRLIGEDINVITVASPDLGQVNADPGQIEQVILNLVLNSRDAMPKGGVLTIETANAVVDEGYARQHIAIVPGRYVMLAVSDTGSGMDADIQTHMFEPFFTTKERDKGTGLGLATSYGIVKQSGGYIWVYSELGKGTTFKIYLPRVDANIEVAGVPVSQEAATGGSETILLVEDAEALRALAREVLERAGYMVLAASDGSEAVRMAEQRKTPIHLLLTDVVMPGMSGREVAEQLKRHRPEIKVVYMSGYTDNAIVHHGVLEEGVAFLPKPFTGKSLVRRVRQVLDSLPARG